MGLSGHERRIRRLLTEAGVESPGFCARSIMRAATGLEGAAYLLAENKTLSHAQLALISEMTRRRAGGEPLAYILGSRGFYEHDFLVCPDTLVPRPETEMLVELSLALCPATAAIFADIGCGCGCVGLSLLAQRPAWQGIMLDDSPEAIQAAMANARRIAPAAVCILGDLFHLPFSDASLDLLVSNPPYIGISEKKDVTAETLAWEPYSALFSEKDGLAHLLAVISEGHRVLRPGGMLIVEHGWRQAEDVLAAMRAAGFQGCADHKDMAGLDRCASCMKP